jgi:hypothetical protein
MGCVHINRGNDKLSMDLFKKNMGILFKWIIYVCPNLMYHLGCVFSPKLSNIPDLEHLSL